MVKLSAALKEGRSRAGISQSELGRRAGVSLATIQNIESGRANPEIKTVEALLETLGLTWTIATRPVGSADLRLLGCPLMAEEPGALVETPTKERLLTTLQILHPRLGSLSDRETQAVHAWMQALADHYPSVWQSAPKPLKSWMTKRREPCSIKLRRLALRALGEYL